MLNGAYAMFASVDPMQWLATLQSSAWASSLRGSLWVYPAIATAHLLGIALLLGPILVHHLAVLGIAFRAERAALARAMPRVAGSGLALAAASGLLLWSARAHEYALHPVFQTKMAILLLALSNIGFVRYFASKSDDPDSVVVRAGAVVSGVAWFGVLVAGRLIGYR